MSNLPKPVVIVVAVVVLALAAFVIMRKVGPGGGENAGRPSKDEIRKMQEQAKQQPGGGRAMPAQPGGR